MKQGKRALAALLLALWCLLGGGCVSIEISQAGPGNTFAPENIPAFSGDPYVVLLDNEPGFTESQLTSSSYETYSPLDQLGRCGQAMACVGTDLMPTEERGAIGSVKPTGWQTVKYDCVDGKYLYNRCHLIGFQLTGENANKQNLITGTRYMNVDGMLPFENMVADYVKETENHVLYRVTPVYNGADLVAQGVQMEAYSVEDGGAGVCFNVYCYNVQPGIVIDYATGETSLDEGWRDGAEPEYDYVLNTNTMKFHLPDCSSVKKIDDENKELYAGSRDALTREGYSPCGNCKP